MPKIPFFVLATVLLIVWRSTRDAAERASEQELAEVAAAEQAEESENTEEKVTELLQVDRICLEIGYRLIPLVQEQSGGGILDHIAQLRRRFATKEGVVLPPVRIKDNIKLAPNA